VQAGDQESDNVMSPLYMPLRRVLARVCRGPYSKDIIEFAFILRIDGKIWYFKFEGCEKLRMNRSEKYVTIDIGVPEKLWRTFDKTAMANYLVDNIADGLRQMVALICKKKLDIDEEKLYRDFSDASNEYLSSMEAIQNSQ
jgi:hypothetical protein